MRIPGPESADYRVNDVPHGTVSQVWYPSPALGMKGVKYTLLEVPGYGHEWKFWRLSLRDLLPRLFQQGS